MESLFEDRGLAVFTQRFQNLRPDHQRQWGKMNHTQMMEHCEKVLFTALGELQIKPVFITRLIGPMLLRKFLKEEKFGKNSPTGKAFKSFSNDQFDVTKSKFLETLTRFSRAGKEGKLAARHPFFGKITHDEWNRLQAIHLNHHLTQFSV